jgi:transketolase
VLSCGYSSLTLYIQLHLGGFGLELSDIQSLRTWGSKTPGHPEFRHTTGVEITTGPLGQGLASAVGMAMASRYERGLFDPDVAPGSSPFDHYIYVFASDGDMQEGVTSEASPLAGTQQLGNLIVFYDHNKISIEDDTNIALSEDTAARYRTLRVACTEGRGRRECRRHRGGHRRGEARHRQAVVHLSAHDHRLSRPEPDEHRQGARRRAR